ncbi:Peroxisome biosynthesis protein pex1, partial [Coemansia sp. RSA 2424]
AVLCPLPGPADRADILARHAARLRADRHIDWPALAARAEHFSGADLQALVYNAFLAAVHEEIESSDTFEATTASSLTSALPAEFAAIGGNKALLASPVERAKLAERLIRLIHSTNIDDRQTLQQQQPDSKAKSGVPVVTMAHFEAAFASTHASLTAADRERFAAIYRAFANSDKKSAVDKQPSRAPIEQRATLA